MICAMPLNIINEYLPDLCLSGGAEGSDLAWGYAAAAAGHSVIHWSFKGHRTQAAAHEIVQLTPEELAIADEHLIRANERVKRRVPFDKPWIVNLLRRNYYQVCTADSLYAIVEMKDWKVQGGTAWAVALFCDMRPGEVYVFDQFTEKWLTLSNGMWVQVSPPRPSGVYAGVGTRKLLPVGKAAIRNIFLKNA